MLHAGHVSPSQGLHHADAGLPAARQPAVDLRHYPAVSFQGTLYVLLLCMVHLIYFSSARSHDFVDDLRRQQHECVRGGPEV